MLARKAPYEQPVAPMRYISSPSPPPTNLPTPPPAPPPTPVSARKRKASKVDEASPQQETKVKANLLRRSREKDAQRTVQLKFIMQEGQRKGERARSEKEEKARTMEIARVPVHVRIEHCAFQRQPDDTPRFGQVERSIMKEASIWTLYAPLLGHEGTTFHHLRSRLRVVYLAEFAANHRGHAHPSQKDGDILTDDILLELSARDPGRIINEHNWQEVLALLAAQQRPCSHMGQVYGKARLATIVASFTCPRST